MDVFLSSLLTGLLFIPSFLIFFFFFYKHKTTYPKLPPGKTGWPLIGETLRFISAGRAGHPASFVNERMNKYSPDIFKTSIAGEPVAVLCGPSGNKFLFSNENKLVVSWFLPNTDKIFSSPNTTVMVTANIMRKIFPEFVKPEALQKYIPIMDYTTRNEVDREWSNPSREVKVFPQSKNLTFSMACKLFMSVEDPGLVARFAATFELVTTGLLTVPINLPGTAFNRAIKAANLLREELMPIVKQRRNDLSEKKNEESPYDLLSKMLMWTDEEGKFLNETWIPGMILGILFASHETTSTLMTFVIYYLADHPDVYAKVLEEQIGIAKSKGPEELLSWGDVQNMKYSRNVVNEVLRIAPPASGAFKEAISDFTYGNFSVPKGWKTFWSVHTTHKDPKYFPNPEKFDPSRFEGNGPIPFTFVPFGGGPRMCPGSEFARLEVLVFMHRLVTKFKWEKVIPNEKIVYDPFPMLVSGLPIRLLPHQN
ncbi:hypothetical protein LguiA_036659 [Lonicera macranthoides]